MASYLKALYPEVYMKAIIEFLHKNAKAKKMFLYRNVTYPFNKLRYRSFGKGSLLYFPMLINNKSCISIGNNVTFREHLRMDAIKKMSNQEFHPRIIIEDGVHAEQNCQIFATTMVHIKRNVTLSSNIFITDVAHEYRSIEEGSILKQNLLTGKTIIDEEAFLGIGVRIIKAVHIGKHAVIGANAVVTKDIPAYCVAVGIPAKIIKRYDPKTKKWEHVTNGGTGNL